MKITPVQDSLVFLSPALSESELAVRFKSDPENVLGGLQECPCLSISNHLFKTGKNIYLIGLPPKCYCIK